MASVVSLYGKKYAIGLLWTPIMESENIRKDAHAELSDMGKDIFVIRKDPAQQIGIGSTQDGLKAGMLPLAAMAADVYVGDNIVVFPLDESTFWGVSIEGGAVLEEYVCESRADLLDWFVKNKNTGRFTGYIGPSSLGIRELATNPTLEGFIQEGKELRTTKLEKVGDTSKKNIKIAIVVFVCIIAVVLFKKHEEHLAMLKKISLQQQLMSRAKHVVVHKKPLEYVLYRPLAEMCINMLGTIPKNIEYWTVKGITCTPNFLEIDYSREARGLMSELLKTLPGFKIKAKGNTATAIRNFNNMKRYQVSFKKDYIKQIKIQDFTVDDFFRRHGFLPKWTQVNNNMLLGVVSHDIKSKNFSVSFPVFPDSWVFDLDSIPGVKVRSVEFKDGKWSLKGVFYYD